MTNNERYEKFNKVFTSSTLSIKEWAKIKVWDGLPPHLLKLDMSIFPDSLETLEVGNYYLNAIKFIPTQTKLKTIALKFCSVQTISIPDEIKSIKHLACNSPLIKLNLGGSAGTIETLELSDEIPKIRVTLPSGMKSLKRLIVGCMGAVVIPKDATSLTNLAVTVNIPGSKIRVPKELVKLEKITVNGVFSGLVVPRELDKVTTLNVYHNGDGLNLPRTIAPKSLSVVSDMEIKLPSTLCAAVEELTISAITDMVLPKSLVALKELYVSNRLGAPARSTITVPKSISGLTQVHTRCDLELKCDVDSLEKISVMNATLTLPAKCNLDNVVDVSGAGAKIINLPDTLPNATTCPEDLLAKSGNPVITPKIERNPKPAPNSELATPEVK